MSQAVVDGDKQALSIHLRQELIHQASHSEVIRVKDGGHNQEHFLLIETKTSRHRESLGREEVYETASIEVTAHYLFGSCYDLVGQFVCDMGGSMKSYEKAVKLTNGGVIINIDRLRGLRIGSYMFHKVVAWAQHFEPSYRIVPITLSDGNDADDDNRERRNHFYEKFGLRFNYRTARGVERAGGRTDPDLTVSDLVACRKWPNIEPSYRFEALKKLALQFQKLRDNCKGGFSTARYYKRKATRIEERLKTFAGFINWVAYIVIAFAAFFLGRMFQYLSH